MFSDTFAGIRPSSAGTFLLMQLLGGALALGVVRLLFPQVDLPAATVNESPGTTR